MKTEIIVKGLIQSCTNTTYEDKTTYVYQFLVKNNKGKLVLIDVKSKEKDLGLSEGQEVAISVSISTQKDSFNMYYSAINVIKEK